MASPIGPQGGIVKPTPVKATVGTQPGGGKGPAGGSVASGKTPSPKGANKINLK